MIFLFSVLASCGKSSEDSPKNGEPAESSQSTHEYPSELSGEELTYGDFVKYSGRYYISDDEVWFGLSASGFEVEFEGTSLTAIFKGQWLNEVVGQGTQVPFIGVFVDGETDPRNAEKIEIYMKEETEYALVSGLPYGKHNVKVYKLTETSCNKLGLKSLKTNGKFADAPQKNKPLIEFYGDSVTCGYGVDFVDQTAFSTDSENATKTFAYLTARMLGADFSFVSASGWGMNHGLGDDSDIPEWFDKADIRSDCAWDNKVNMPDIVVINLGANDNQYIIGNVSGPVSTEESKNRMDAYLSAYKSFIERILKTYGRNIPVFCCYGTMGEANIYTPLENLIYDEFQDKGCPNVYPVKLSDGAVNGDKALHGHPNLKTHADSADILVKAITENTNYVMRTENIR